MIQLILVFSLMFLPSEGLAAETCAVQKSLPKSVKIGRSIYEVKYVKKIEGRGDLVGEMIPARRQIIVKNDAREEMESTLLHEIIHATAAEYNFELTEEQVLALESTVYRTFKKTACTPKVDVVKYAECDVGCRRGGWDSGEFISPNGCKCSDNISYSRITMKTVQLPARKAE